MPGSYYGYDFNPDEWKQAGWSGLAGGVQGMQGANTWAETLMGLSGGYQHGMEGSLETSLKAREEQQKQAEIEAQKAAEDRASGVMSDWAMGQIPPELQSGLAPPEAFATPEDRAKYLQGQAGTAQTSAMTSHRHEIIKEAIKRLGHEPTGDPETDAKFLDELTQQQSKPEGMTPYQQRMTDLRQQEIDSASGRRGEADASRSEAEAQQEHLAGYLYSQLPDDAKANLPKPYGTDLPTSELVKMYQKALGQQTGMGDERVQQVLGEDYTGVPSIDNPNARERIQSSWYDEQGDGTAVDAANGGLGQVGTGKTSSDMSRAAPSVAPGMPRSGQPKKAQPAGSMPTGGKTPTATEHENPAVLSDKGLEGLLRSTGVPPARAQSFLQNPVLASTVRQKWAEAKTQKDRDAVRAWLVSKLQGFSFQ